MKKKLSKSNYKFFLTELTEHKDRGIINQQQLDDMMTFYEEDSGINFIKILVTIGSILIGLGILSFIASNWEYIGKIAKILIIVVFLGFSIFASFRLEKGYPKTSRAMLYLSTLIYGAGIFLMEQIFNYSGEFQLAFLLWSVGVLVMSILLREKLLFLFAHVLSIIYISGSFNENIIVYSLILICVFYIASKYFNHDKIVTFFNNLVALDFLLYFLYYKYLDNIYVAIVFFIVGLIMYYGKHRLNIEVFKLQGIIVSGISGVMLTYKQGWEELLFIKNGSYIAICFGILFLIYLLYLVRRGSLTALVFTCVLILRYYFDTLYDFMPKSLFFIVGGFILLGFGYYFERLRKNSGGALDEKNI
ncbi:DUF2157 domain-containing protein [Clostridium sp. JNZ J1-5]